MTKIPRVTRETIEELRMELASFDDFKHEQPELWEWAASWIDHAPASFPLRERVATVALARTAMHVCWLALARQMEKGQ